MHAPRPSTALLHHLDGLAHVSLSWYARRELRCGLEVPDDWTGECRDIRLIREPILHALHCERVYAQHVVIFE